MIYSRTIFFAAVAAAALLCGLGALTLAQGVGTGSPPPQVGAGMPILPPGALRAEDPTHSAEWALLVSHKDVDTEIGLNDHQRDALADLQTKAREEIMNRMRSAAAGSSEEANQTPEERRLQYQQREAQQRAYMEGYPDEMAKRAEGVLKPAQVKRLRELDLQWRGPLALADPKVAEALKLSSEQRDKVAAALQDYRVSAEKIRKKVMPGFSQPGSAGEPQTPPAPPSVADMQARVAKARTEMDQARQEAGEKALAVLSPEQHKRWQEMLGKSFAF